MNMIWKRTLSLALSAVLLMSNVPFAALATENTATETQPTETQPAFEQGTTDAANNGEGDPIPQDVVNYEIYINGQQITSANANGVTGTGLDGKITYANGILTLEDATIDAATAHAIETKIPLTIKLAGENQVTAHGPDKSAIFADMGSSLTITSAGEDTGILEATSVKSRAIYMHGQDANGNKASLTITGNVTMSAETENTAGAYGIVSPNGVVVKDGDFHLKFSAADGAIAPVALEDEQPMYMLPAGYIRTGEGFVEVQGNVPMKSGAFEFVSASHLCEDYIQSTTHHYKTCDDMQCPFCTDDVRIAYGTHENVTEANCQSGASCSVCGVFSDPDETKHSTNDTAYKTENGKHILVHALETCRKPMPDAEEGECRYSYVCQNGCIKRVCGICLHDDDMFRIVAPEEDDLIWNGEPKKAELDYDSEDLNESAPVIKYYAYTGDERNAEPMANDQFPTEPGKYAAMVDLTTFGDISDPEVVFVIKPFALTTENVVLKPEKVTYDGEPKALPVVEVTGIAGATYDVSYTCDGADASGSEKLRTDAGIITVTIIGKGNCSGTVVKTFTIEQLPTTANMFVLDTQLIPYDGKGHKAEFSGDEMKIGLGEVTAIKYYNQDGELQTNEAGNPAMEVKNAGAYTLKIDVSGGKNYADAKDLENTTPWRFTIEQASVTKPADIGDQIIVFNDEDSVFRETAVPGIEGEMAEGTWIYRIGDASQQYESALALSDELKKHPGEYTVHYTFQAKGNYKGNFSGELKVRVVEIEFTVDDVKATADNTVNLAPESKRVYKEPDIVALKDKKIKASIGEKTDAKPIYSIKYQQGKNGTIKDSPDAGMNTFYVMYKGTIDGVEYTDVVVCEGTITVKERTPVPTAPTPKNRVVSDQEEFLAEAGTPEVGQLQYSLYKTHSYAAEIPKRSAAGAYYVWYKEVTPDNDNYADSEPQRVTVVITPKLEATYGQSLADIKSQLTKGFTFNNANPETTLVGDAGTRTIKLDYTPDDMVNFPTLTDGYDVPLTVKPKNIELDISLNDNDGYIPYEDRKAGNNLIVKIKGTETPLEYSSTKKEYSVALKTESGIRTTYTVSDVNGGNYTFEDATITAKLYRPVHKALTEDNFPEDNLNGSNHDTLAEVKSALSGEIKEDNYPESKMKFFRVYIAKNPSGSTWVENTADDAFPPDGITYEIPFSDLESATQDDKFKVSVMDTAGDNAGQEAVEVTAGVTSTGVTIQLSREAAVCVAVEVDPNATYKVSTSASNGKVEFTVGSDTTKKTSADAVKVGEKLTITATPDSNYALTKIQYIYKDGTTNKAKEVKQNDDGKYILEMPAMDITIKATFAKKTTNTKNPYSGDTSNIYLWLTVLVASGVGIAALMAFWFKKRRK